MEAIQNHPCLRRSYRPHPEFLLRPLPYRHSPTFSVSPRAFSALPNSSWATPDHADLLTGKNIRIGDISSLLQLIVLNLQILLAASCHTGRSHGIISLLSSEMVTLGLKASNTSVCSSKIHTFHLDLQFGMSDWLRLH